MKSEIILGDCIDVMETYANKSVDAIITDPPCNAKNIGPHERTYSQGVMQLPLEEYKKFCNSWITEALRIAKRVVFTPGIANVCYYPQPDWILCWHKPQAVSFNRMGGFNAWEAVLHGSAGRTQGPQPRCGVMRCGRTPGVPAPACC